MSERNKEEILHYDDEEIKIDPLVEDSNTRPENSYDDEGIKYKISTVGKDIDIDGYVKRLKNKAIIKPDYQRKYIWKIPRASLLIESL